MRSLGYHTEMAKLCQQLAQRYRDCDDKGSAEIVTKLAMEHKRVIRRIKLGIIYPLASRILENYR